MLIEEVNSSYPQYKKSQIETLIQRKTHEPIIQTKGAKNIDNL